MVLVCFFFFFSSRRRHTRFKCDWSSDVCSSDLPGEGIYNDSAGSIEGNSPFQAVWLSEDVRDDYLAKIRSRADHNGAHYPGPFVFEGNAPADVKENLVLNKLLAASTFPPP